MRWVWIWLVLFLAVVALFYVPHKQEKFTDIPSFAIPADVYTMGDPFNKPMYFQEHAMDFFVTTLKRRIGSAPVAASGPITQMPDTARADLEQRVSEFVETTLNQALDVSETSLFQVVKMTIDETRSTHATTGWWLTVNVLVHRPHKLYGAALQLTFTYQNGSLSLQKVHPIGLVFEDKINPLANAVNQDVDTHLSYDQIPRDKILKDSKQEQKEVCAHYAHMQQQTYLLPWNVPSYCVSYSSSS